jgi:hypothetical protein
MEDREIRKSRTAKTDHDYLPSLGLALVYSWSLVIICPVGLLVVICFGGGGVHSHLLTPPPPPPSIFVMERQGAANLLKYQVAC